MHATRWGAGQGVIKGCMSGPGMPRCGCHAPTLFSGQLSMQRPFPPQRSCLPTTRAFSPRSVRQLARQAGLSDSAPRHSGAATGNPCWASLASLVLALQWLWGGMWGQPPLPPSVGFLRALTRTPLPPKCLDCCSKGLIRAQIRVRSTWSITGQLFCDFSLTFFIQNAGNHLLGLWSKARLDSAVTRGVLGSSGGCTMVSQTSAHPHEN